MFKSILLAISVLGLVLFGLGCSVGGDNNPAGGNPPALSDIDADGTPDINDTDIDGDGIPNTEDADIDGDGTPNTADSDLDGDGIANINDNDLDGDGTPNTSDPDIDGNGITNDNDPDLDGDGVSNGNDIDIDGDGIINTQDPDLDGDGISNTNDPVPDGTGDGSSGTQGASNGSSSDQNTGTNNNNSGSASGISVEASHQESFNLSISAISANTVIDTTVHIELADVRQEIADNEIDLTTAVVTSISVTGDASVAAFLAANAGAKYILKIYFQLPSNSRVLMMQTPDQSSIFPLNTLGGLAAGISINHGIYAVMPGYEDYLNIIKNESIPGLDMIAELTLVDGVNAASSLKLNFSMVIAGIKKI